MSYELRVQNPRVTSSNPGVTSSNSQVTTSNPRVRRLKARVARLKAGVGRLKARIKRLKARVETIKPRLKWQTYELKEKIPSSKILNFTKLSQQLSRSFSLQTQTPLKSITDIVLLGFSLILVPGMFISYYTAIYFFVKNFFFECLYFSEYDNRMFLFVFWLKNRSSIKYVRNQGNGGESSKMFTDAYRGRGVSFFMCTYALTLSLFLFLSFGVVFYLQKFNLTFKKGCACQKWLFFSNEINFCFNEIKFFVTLNCFFEPNLAKMVLILNKTRNFSVTSYFEIIL